PTRMASPQSTWISPRRSPTRAYHAAPPPPRPSSGRSALLRRRLNILRRPAEEQPLAVAEQERPPDRRVAPVSSLIPLDRQLRARRHRLRRDPPPEQRVRAAAFDHPRHRLAVVADDLEMEPRMRIDPLDLRDRALQLHRPVDRELRRERVVRRRRSAHERCP